MTLNLHYRYAARTRGMWVTVNDKGEYDLTSDKKKAEVRWDIRGALGIKDRFINATWNVTMGDKPVVEIEKIHRPQRIHHWW